MISKLQIEDIQYIKSENIIKSSQQILNYPILYFGLHINKKRQLVKIYIGESNNFKSRYKKIDLENNIKNEQLITLIKNTLNENNNFVGFSVSNTRLFNASATKQLETVFVKLLCAYFGKNLVQNVKIEQNIHFYNNKNEIDDLQEEIFNNVIEKIFSRVDKNLVSKLNYKYSLNLQRNKLNPIIMDDLQSEIVKELTKELSNTDNYVIQGNAGSGKTLVIVSLWEEMIRASLDTYFKNPGSVFKRIYITSAKKNQLKLLQKYVEETLATFEFSYSSSDFKKIKDLKINKDVISIYTGKDLSRITENSVLIIDEAHGFIHTLHKQNANVFFIQHPLNKQPGNAYPDGKYKDERNIYNYIYKQKLIFVFDDKQITKKDNLNLQKLMDIFQIKEQNLKKLNINYRNKVGIGLYNLLIKGSFDEEYFDEDKLKFVASFEELISLHQELSLKTNQSKYNRLLANVSFAWKNNRFDIFKEALKYVDTTLQTKILDNGNYLTLNEVINDFPNLNIELREHNDKIMNSVKEEDWFESDWFSLSWKEKAWYRHLNNEKLKEERKRFKTVPQDAIYNTFGYSNAVIGRDLLNSFIYIAKDICIYNEQVIPNLKGLKIKFKNQKEHDFDKKRWNEYTTKYADIEKIEGGSHHSLTFFKAPAIPTYKACQQDNENYFEKMREYILNNYFILFSRATQTNYIYCEDKEIEAYISKYIV